MVQPDTNDPVTGPFWLAASEQRLVMSWCERCDCAVWYPKPACPECGGLLHWKTLSGDATLLSWTVVSKTMNPSFNGSYIPALVVPRDAPGTRLVTQLVDCEPAELVCDMPLALRFGMLQPREGDPYMAPLFTPFRLRVGP
ncbi:hypothetical protein FV139_01205 [Parahaliea maris]|uniref:DNA-binding protein n=1 Tax=Parahaliea maris TaxID=2716870 RepID=A0A5C9AA38_9GAMM|nr:hypothetical protein FV139_01205 [Parahaliea maris]